jgi:uncharacterized protein YozE (UPF0346 family)
MSTRSKLQRKILATPTSSKPRSFHDFISTYEGPSKLLRDLAEDLRSDAAAPKTDAELRDYLNRFDFIVSLGLVDAAWRSYRRAVR